MGGSDDDTIGESLTGMPLLVFCLLVHGLLIWRKCPLHPESAHALSSDLLELLTVFAL